MFDSNQKDKQVEFFNDLSDLPRKDEKRKFALRGIAISLSSENLIIISIALIMSLIVCYSLGVEKGKQLAQLRIEGPEHGIINGLAEENQDKPSKKTEEPREKKQRVEVAQTTPQKPQMIAESPYIQVASFRTDKYAAKEMERLKNKGYRTFSLDRGKYKVVCVGGYIDKNQANKALQQLKQMYADCILRQ